MAQVTIPLPTLAGKKTFMVGIALILAGLSSVFHDVGTGALIPSDLINLLAHEGTQKVLEGMGFIAVRLGVNSAAKTSEANVAESVLNKIQEPTL